VWLFVEKKFYGDDDDDDDDEIMWGEIHYFAVSDLYLHRYIQDTPTPGPQFCALHDKVAGEAQKLFPRVTETFLPCPRLGTDLN